MRFIETQLQGAFIIEPKVYKDNRGFFVETHNSRVFKDNGIDSCFVQDNYSFSKNKGVVRGLHLQRSPHEQSKLVWVVSGSVLDVIVDIRKGSPTFGKWVSYELNSSELKMIYVPKGFAHGFCTLEDNTHVLYKVDSFYAPDADTGLLWNDEDLAITWPVKDPVLSEKDKGLPRFKDLM